MGDLSLWLNAQAAATASKLQLWQQGGSCGSRRAVVAAGGQLWQQEGSCGSRGAVVAAGGQLWQQEGSRDGAVGQ